MNKRNISVGADHKLHDGLDNEGERGHGHEDRDEGAEELHQGDGGGVPQQDHLRLPECDETTLYNPLDNQRTGTKGLDIRLPKLIDIILALGKVHKKEENKLIKISFALTHTYVQ